MFEYFPGRPQEMAQRGISTLMVDCPGSGEALRLLDQKSWVETGSSTAAGRRCCRDELRTLRTRRATADQTSLGKSIRTS